MKRSELCLRVRSSHVFSLRKNVAVTKNIIRVSSKSATSCTHRYEVNFEFRVTGPTF